jgi:hypothetical protein
MPQMILKKLPSSSDVAQLSNLDLNSFTEAFNANAITPSIAIVELANDQATVILGDFAWEVEENDWYEIIENDLQEDTYIKAVVFGESVISFEPSIYVSYKEEANNIAASLICFADKKLNEWSSPEIIFDKKDNSIVTKTIKPTSIQAIIDYMNEGEPDINVVKSELGEIIERHNGTYDSTEE